MTPFEARLEAAHIVLESWGAAHHGAGTAAGHAYVINTADQAVALVAAAAPIAEFLLYGTPPQAGGS